jgi:outer membrane receptor protein involved in Fe transport
MALVVTMLAVPLSAAADASPPPRAFHIAAGKLDDVLQAFTRDSGIELLYPDDTVRTLDSPGVTGITTDREALERLLRGTGLSVVPAGERAFVLRASPRAIRPPPPARMPARAAVAVPLEPVDVTGTHIRRTEMETASPVTVISREQIDRGGYETLYDLLRAQPGIRVANAGVGVADVALFQNNGLAGATGASSVDLRGLGSYATLVLVNGHRLAGYGLSQDDLGTVTDLNGIPLAMVDHVDILRDGASAIYGSDAMAGVINIVLRKKADGVRVSWATGLSSRGDAAQHRASASLGGRWGEQGNLLLMVDSLDRAPTLGRDRAWSRSTQAVSSDNGPEAADDFYLQGAQLRSQAADCLDPTSTTPGRCVDASSAQTTVQTGMRSRALYLHADRAIGDVQAYADLRWTSQKQRQQTAPLKYNVALDAGTPDNPGDTARLFYGYRFDDLGPVRDVTTSNTYVFTAGVEGAWGDGDWHVDIDDQRASYDDYLGGLLPSDTLGRALDDGSYRLKRRNAPSLLAALSPQASRHARSARDALRIQATHPLVTLAGGPLLVTAGAEVASDRLDDRPDPLLTSGRVFQFVTPSDRSANRWTTSAYAEASAPLTSRLEAGVAWRVDRSEGYGNAFSPKASLRWSVTDTLTARATWARGYRAPATLDLGRTSAEYPNGFLLTVPDSLLPCRALAVPADGGNACYLSMSSVRNPDLRPETSHSHTLGLVWAPSSTASLALDYFQLRREHEIDSLPLSYALVHPAAYPRAFARDASGALTGLLQQWVNLGHTSARTLDIDGEARLVDRPAWGVDLRVTGSYLWQLDRQTFDGTPVAHGAGYASQPRWTGLAELVLHTGDWTVAANARYTGRYRNAQSSTDPFGCEADGRTAVHCSTPDFILVDASVAYRGLPRWTFALNLHNVFDHAPVYYGSPGIAYNPLFDDVIGRSWMGTVSFRL